MNCFRRKIKKVLDSWFNSAAKMPTLLTCIRQYGKTEAIRNFAIRNNLQLIEMKF